MSVKNITTAAFSTLAVLVFLLIVHTLAYRDGHNDIVILAILLAANTVVLVRVFIHRVLSPLKLITEGMERMGEKDFGGSLHIKTDDEFITIEGYCDKLSQRIQELEVQESELLRTIPDAVVELDRSGSIKYLNGSAVRLTGYGEAEVLGMPCTAFIPAELCSEFKEAFKTALDGKTVSSCGLPFILKGGRVNSFEWSVMPVWKSGEVTGCLFIGKDTEELVRLSDELGNARKEAEENSEKLKKTIKDLEEFALLAVRRELKMREIRERFQELKNAPHHHKKEVTH